MNFEPQNPETPGADDSAEQPVSAYPTVDAYYVLPSPRTRSRSWSIATGIVFMAGILVLVALVATAINALGSDEDASDSTDTASVPSTDYSAPQPVPNLSNGGYVIISPSTGDPGFYVRGTSACTTVTTLKPSGSSSLKIVPQVLRCSTAPDTNVQPTINAFFQAWASHDSDTALTLLAPGVTRDYVTGMFESVMYYSPISQVTIGNPNVTIAVSESGYTLTTAKVHGTVHFMDGGNRNFSAFLIKPVGDAAWKIQSISFN